MRYRDSYPSDESPDSCGSLPKSLSANLGYRKEQKLPTKQNKVYHILPKDEECSTLLENKWRGSSGSRPSEGIRRTLSVFSRLCDRLAMHLSCLPPNISRELRLPEEALGSREPYYHQGMIPFEQLVKTTYFPKVVSLSQRHTNRVMDFQTQIIYSTSSTVACLTCSFHSAELLITVAYGCSPWVKAIEMAAFQTLSPYTSIPFHP